MQSEGSEWRRLYFNSGGIRGKKEAGFTKEMGFFSASVRPQSGLHPSCQPCAAMRTRGGRGGSQPKWAGASLGTPPSTASRCSRRVLACNRRGRSRETRAGTVQKQDKARKHPPKCLKKWPLGSTANMSQFPSAPSLSGGSFPAVPRSFPSVSCSLSGVFHFALVPPW